MRQIEVMDRRDHAATTRVGHSEAEEWDTFLHDRDGVDIQQSVAWARVKAPGHVSRRAIVRDAGGHIVAGAQLLARHFGRGLVKVG